jgi:hypothetical protein
MKSLYPFSNIDLLNILKDSEYKYTLYYIFVNNESKQADYINLINNHSPLLLELWDDLN